MKDARRVIQLRSYALAFAVALSPAFFQTSYSCERGDTFLLSLELEVSGQDQIANFSTTTRSYAVTTSSSTAVLRVVTKDPSSNATYRWLAGGTAIGPPVAIGVGGGQVTVTVPDGQSQLYVNVQAPEGALDNYIVDVTNLTTAVTETLPMTCDHDVPLIANGLATAFELTADPLWTVSANQLFDAQLTGNADVPEDLLDAIGGLGGVVPHRVALAAGTVPVVVESGATGPDVDLLLAPTEWSCALDAAGNYGPGVGPYPSCDPANDIPDGNPATLDANTDCVGGGAPDPTNPCAPFVELTVVDGAGDACAACTALSTTKGTVCGTTTYCATLDDLAFPLSAEIGTYTADPAPEVLLGFTPYGGTPPSLRFVAQYPPASGVPSGLFAGNLDCTRESFPDSTFVALDVHSWGGPELISLSQGSASDPDIAVDASGNAIAVWRESFQNEQTVWSNRYTAGVGWGTAEIIKTAPGNALQLPKVAVDPAGNAIAVWEQSTPPIISVYANRYTAGGGWGTAVLLETDDVNKATGPQVGIDASGNAIAVWGQSDGVRPSIWANRYTAGVGWGTAALIETDDTVDYLSPEIAVNPSGNAVAVWNPNSAGGLIGLNQYTPGVGWGLSAVFSSGGPGSPGSAAVAIDPSGNAVAVWHESDLSPMGLSEIRASYYTAGGSWSLSQSIGPAVDFFSGLPDPDVAMDPGGNAMVVWTYDPFSIGWNRYTAGVGWSASGPPIGGGVGRIEMDPSGNAVAVVSAYPDIISIVYTAGVGWGTAAVIETEVGDAYGGAVAVAPDGDAIAVWRQDNGSRNTIRANEYTAGGSWGTAGVVGLDLGDADVPQVAVDPNGDAVAVWRQHDGSVYNIYANRLTSEVWGTPELLETGTESAGPPQVAVDPNGDAVAVWRQHDGSVYNIYANRLTSGVWGTPELLETSTGIADAPQVAVDPSGDAVAVWRQYSGGYRIYANRLTSGVWGTAERLGTGSFGGLGPQVAVDPNGDAVAVWEGFDNICANRLTSGVWGTTEQLETGTGTADDPQVAVAPNGDAVAVWRQYDGIADSIYANRLTSGVWGTAEQLETGTGTADDPQVAFAPNGDAVAVWRQYDGIADSIYANRLTSGTWGTAELLEADDARNADAPQVAVDANGDAVAVWRHSDGSVWNIYTNRLAASGVWGTPELLETDAGNAAHQQVAVDPNGNAVAVWKLFDGTIYNVYANRFQ